MKPRCIAFNTQTNLRCPDKPTSKRYPCLCKTHASGLKLLFASGYSREEQKRLALEDWDSVDATTREKMMIRKKKSGRVLGKNSARNNGVEREFISTPVAADLATDFLKRSVTPYQIQQWLDHPEIGNVNGAVTDKRRFPIYNYAQEGEKKNIRIMKFWFVKFLESIREQEFKPGKKMIEIRSIDEMRVVKNALDKHREHHQGDL